ncbi:MAG TPA: glycoside hydrolase family 30 beta sandwich domain-containing protein [Chthoniobacterales bacterium]
MNIRRFLYISHSLVIGQMALLPSLSHAADKSVEWICSTTDQPWKRMPPPVLGLADPDIPPQVCVEPSRTYQTMDGFGGCFNELSWAALGKASAVDRDKVLGDLFGNEGCAFTMGRIPIGASDFAFSAYSLDDTPGDLSLKDFSIARDQKALIQFVKAAMAVRPSLRCWGSPWSPPAWMKTNDNYSQGSIKWEPAILRSYATYLARWVEAYRAAGIKIFALMPQNESNILSPYPSCLWTAAHLRDFIADYLGPTLRDRRTNVELWLGTLNGDPSNSGNNINYRAVTVLNDPKASAFITGLTFQYDSGNLIGEASELFPGKKLMQSESECNSGKNSWADAMHLYGLMKHYIDGGASSYFAWNMVLNEGGMSTWKWRQNALITVNSATGKVAYNGEYYVMRHFSQFVKPGAKRVLTTGPWGDKIAFLNPDGSTVIVLANSGGKPFDVGIAVAGLPEGTFHATLPPRSVSTFVVPPVSAMAAFSEPAGTQMD